MLWCAGEVESGADRDIEGGIDGVVEDVIDSAVGGEVDAEAVDRDFDSGLGTQLKAHYSEVDS